ncbi:hypothetical protein FQR65_LT04629 [Abscondita terminalis]|nr:hypothetical protein FQR65_LT04629 [Abscondita terminalis]
MCNLEPVFKLENIPRGVIHRKPTRSISYKERYSPGVKTTGWYDYEETLPRDNNPYCPGSLNLHLAHYNKLGTESKPSYVTETRSMQSQVYLKNNVDKLFRMPFRYMVNYYTYTDTLACETNSSEKLCPVVCADPYDTSMKIAYTPPYPYVMERFAFPVIPHLLHRKYRWTSNVQECPYKFRDDAYLKELKDSQCIKKSKMISYNPMTMKYSDGSSFPERNSKCVS